ncbi:MAG: hypothetical protein U9N36_12220 [Euryarchaeota archaeon]|nr:hypothetical protein [Euryarchaeota archaeon]
MPVNFWYNKNHRPSGTMKKRLYVPHPGHFDGSKELVFEAGKGIYSIFMAGSPDYVGTGRSNPSSPQIKGIREQTEYTHKNGVAVEAVLNSSCLGGRQLPPAEKYAAQDIHSQITKQMRHCRRCRADAIQAAGRGCAGEVLSVRWGSRGVWKGVYPKFTSDILPNQKDMRTRV